MARPFRVRYLGRRHARASADISAYVTSIDKWLDVGSGEVAQCQLMLECRDGAFLASANSGRTPIISMYDEIEVRIGWNDAGESTQRRIFYVNRILPQRRGDSVQAQVEMFGREGRLRQQFTAGRRTGERYLDMLTGLVAEQVQLANPRQPILSALCVVPAWAVGTVDFGGGETSVYDAVMRILGRLNLPAAAGGAHDVFSLTFEEHATNPDVLHFCVRSQGTRNSADTPPTLDADADADFMSCTQVLEAGEATRVRLRGRQDFGSLPAEYAEWRDAKAEFTSYPDYSPTVDYGEGARVRWSDRSYERLGAHGGAGTSPSNPAAWRRVRLHELLGTGFEYSPWTNGKAVAWQNMMSNPGNNRGRDYTSPAVPDGNLQVRDDTFSRDWAHFGPINSTSDIPAGYAAGTPPRLVDGTRVLCGPTWPGSDPYGRAYANSVAVRVGGRLIVSKATVAGGPVQAHRRGDQVAVISTGRLWEWQRPATRGGTGSIAEARSDRQSFASSNGALAWRDITGSTLGSDCFHRPSNVENVEGFLGRGDADAGGVPYSRNSAVRITYTENVPAELAGTLAAWIANFSTDFAAWLSGLSGGDLTLLRDFGLGSQGWWATLFMAPGPPRTQGSTVTRGEFWPDSLLNLNNLERGSLEADTAGALGETSGIAFLLDFEILSGSSRLAFQGDFPFKIVVYDADGNVWEKDEVIRFQGEPQQVRAYWSQFRIRRSRTPIGISAALTNLTTPERLELEQLNERRVKMIVMQFDRPYDEFGRYNPAASWTEWFQTIFSGAPGSLTHRGTIDGLHFMKPATTVATATAHEGSSPVRDYSEISSVRQLRQVAATELEVAQAQLATYTIEYRGRADIGLDDTIYYHDRNTVATAEPSASTPNQRRLVVTRVLHAVTPGAGWTTKVTAVDRVGD